MTRVLVALALALLAPEMRAASDELAEAERSVALALQSQDRWRAEREAAGSDAATLAQEIAQLKAQTTGARADPALEQRLHAFDRQAARLDDLERRWHEATRQVERTRGAFQALAEERARQLTGQGSRAAAELLALEAARRRVLVTAADTGPRPPLDIAPLDSDTPLELHAKQALLQSEQARLAGEPQRLARAAALLAARLDWKRRLLVQARGARRAAGSEWRLLESEADALQADLRELEGEERELQERVRMVREWQQGLEQRLRTLQARLDSLTAARPR